MSCATGHRCDGILLFRWGGVFTATVHGNEQEFWIVAIGLDVGKI